MKKIKPPVIPEIENHKKNPGGRPKKKNWNVQMTYSCSEEQEMFVRVESDGNVSAYVRGLIEAEMKRVL